MNTAHRREKYYSGELAVIDLDTGAAPIVLRFYNSDAVSTACLWVHRGETHATGSGRAGGHGYHRPSAAAQGALETAGFPPASPIDARGDSAIRDALDALARHLGLNRFVIHEAHP